MLTVPRVRAKKRRQEWLVLTLLLLSLVAWLSASESFSRVNHMVQDLGLRPISRPAHPDIVIIAIDDRSIAAIGRWPWRRALHAQLINSISAQSPLVIGMDVLLNEEDLDYPADDQLLTEAIERSARVVLPVTQRGYATHGAVADLPWHSFARAAAGLGHVHVAPDSDGVVRGLYGLEGSSSMPWPHFSATLLCVASGTQPCANAKRLPLHRATVQDAAWERTEHTLIAYAGGPSHFTTYSYIDVLRGETPPDAFKAKYVLVGAIASGLGDTFATPVNHDAGLMPGVEVVSHVLDARLAGIRLQPASTALNVVFNLVPVACALLALLLLGPFAALLTSAALAVVVLCLAIWLPGWAGLQLAPAPAFLGLMLAYPLWSWRRLSAAAHFLRVEMERLQSDGLSMRLQERRGDSSDFLERRINAVERATRQLRELHHFVSESLQQLPSPTLVCDPHGYILLTNVAARRHVGGDAGVSLQGLSAVALLEDLLQEGSEQPLLTLERLHQGTMPEQSEGRDSQGRRTLVQCKPFTDLPQAGWLLTLVDITDMRQAQLQRDQAVNFISHDIRAPNASILTLLEMQRAYPGRLPTDELMERIERYAQTSLGMAESFVQLASAQSQEYRMTPVDLVAVLAETVDDAWAQSRDAQVDVNIDDVPPTASTAGDPALLRRALANLLSNAIKYSPAQGKVQCSIVQRGTFWMLSVRDQGPGIPAELQNQLFSPFQRLHDRSHPSIGGVGLGLALVSTVVKRHGGTLEVQSDTGLGATFRLLLPVSQQSEEGSDF